jgi:hypothetical protein
LYASANAINKNPNAIICIILTDFIFYGWCVLVS